MPKDVYTEYTALQGHEKRVAKIMGEFALTAQSDPGILLFLPYALAAVPRKYFVLERYLNESVFETHITSEYRHSFVAALAPHLEVQPPALVHLSALP